MKTITYVIKKFGLRSVGRGTNVIGSRYKELLELFRDQEFKKGAEIGVERGIYSEQICKMVPGIKLYCVDPWKAYHGYREHVTQSKLDGLYRESVKRLKPYKCKIIRQFSEKAHKKIPDKSLHFVYIDGNHDFFHVTQDLFYWVPKVMKGGIIAGHDYIRYKKSPYQAVNHVKDVIPAYTYAMGIDTWFILREPNEASSWFWVQK